VRRASLKRKPAKSERTLTQQWLAIQDYLFIDSSDLSLVCSIRLRPAMVPAHEALIKNSTCVAAKKFYLSMR
jgi:hypothetical protein